MRTRDFTDVVETSSAAATEALTVTDPTQLVAAEEGADQLPTVRRFFFPALGRSGLIGHGIACTCVLSRKGTAHYDRLSGRLAGVER